MSLSKDRGAPNKFMSGKVIMTDGIRSMKLTDLEGAGHQPGWNPAVEAEYMDRVRRKASERARDVLRAAKLEAEHLREQARREGYAEGVRQAREELELHRDALSEAVAGAVQQFEQSGAAIWLSHRRTLAALVCAAVERVVGLELSENRRAVLQALLDKAVEELEARMGLMIVVHPEDAATIEDLLRRAAERHPELSGWRVRPDAAMEPGGLVVESASGMVDSSMATRREAVNEILDLLTVGPGSAEEAEAEARLLAEEAEAERARAEREAAQAAGAARPAGTGVFPGDIPDVPHAPASINAAKVQAWEEAAPVFEPVEEQAPAAVAQPREEIFAPEAQAEVEAQAEPEVPAEPTPQAPERGAASAEAAPPVEAAPPAEAAQAAMAEQEQKAEAAPAAEPEDPFEAAQASMAEQEKKAEAPAEVVSAPVTEPEDPFEAAQAAMAKQEQTTEAPAEVAPAAEPEDPFEAAQAAMVEQAQKAAPAEVAPAAEPEDPFEAAQAAMAKQEQKTEASAKAEPAPAAEPEDTFEAAMAGQEKKAEAPTGAAPEDPFEAAQAAMARPAGTDGSGSGD
ncbi:MAG: hypothetical protein H0S85_16710 [Desulfovibrionaceae bacterium]|jgi:flagellar assembly protein FliH|nr:hypothetical protein [Desulfovibrionaceae bacterium]